MNKHVSGAEREAASSAKETQALEFDAMTWGAEGALKAMAAYQVESLRFIARRTCCNLELMRRLRRCGRLAGDRASATVLVQGLRRRLRRGAEQARLDRLPARPERLRAAARADVLPAGGGKRR